MNKLLLKNRIIFVEQKNKIKVSDKPMAPIRRGKNYVHEDEESSETFSDIFDVESEYSELSKSTDLFKDISKNDELNK